MMVNIFQSIVKKYLRFMPSVIIIVSIVLIGLSARLLYHKSFRVMSVNDDAISYFYTGKDVWKTGVLVNEWRTPLYGILITLPFVTSGQLDTSLKLPVFFHILYSVTMVQVALGLGGLILTYLLFLRMNIPRLIAWFMSMVFAANFYILIWERLILTEFPTYILLLLLALLLSRVLYEGKPVYMFLMTLVSISLVFIRPSSVMFPLIAWGIALYVTRKRTTLNGILLCLVIYICSIGIYIQANGAITGYYGLSRIGTVNLFGKILEYRLPIEAAKGREPLYSEIQLFYNQNPYQDAWNLFKAVPQLYETRSHAQFADITSTIIQANSREYISKSISNIPLAIIAQDSSAVSFHIKHQENEYLVDPWRSIYRKIHLPVWITFISLPFIIVSFLIRPRKRPALVAFGALSVVYAVLTSTFLTFDPYDYGRHMVAVQPFLWGITAYSFIYLYQLAKKALSLYNRIHKRP